MTYDKLFSVHADKLMLAKKLNTEQKGRLLEAIINLCEGETKIEFNDPLEEVIYAVIEQSVEYLDVKRGKNKQNGSKGGRPNKQEVYEKITPAFLENNPAFSEEKPPLLEIITPAFSENNPKEKEKEKEKETEKEKEKETTPLTPQGGNVGGEKNSEERIRQKKAAYALHITADIEKQIVDYTQSEDIRTLLRDWVVMRATQRRAGGRPPKPVCGESMHYALRALSDCCDGTEEQLTRFIECAIVYAWESFFVPREAHQDKPKRTTPPRKGTFAYAVAEREREIALGLRDEDGHLIKPEEPIEEYNDDDNPLLNDYNPSPREV